MARNAAARWSGLVVAAVALSSCSTLKTPPATFELSPPEPVSVGAASTRSQILLPEPTATQALDSQRIVVKPTPQTIENLANSQWSDRLPRLVQLRLLQAFQNTGRIGAAGVPGQGLAIDYQVVTELRRFEIAFQPGATAVVEISVKALNDRTGVVRGSRVFQAAVPVANGEPSGYVTSLDAAFGQVADEIVAWMIRLI
ncbi:ABC-type transport auxiliary lipoprotein family protein [Aureimonas sp. SK2]|uniref:ABC-type transport auxiliary lipoprotein family protein n=1 Tax=Aureimonas sp. SK2 TaxID=3015992 RepID=UPI0024440360|nr:ABC-type transport auxiliary lipoprotein family protein [Aureimonas sp. SK2]